MNSLRFLKLVENCRLVAWNHQLSTIAKGWNEACVASGDRSLADAYWYKDEVVEIYSSYNSRALRVVRVENWNPTTVIKESGKVVRIHAEQWKLEEHINRLAAETPLVKKTAFFEKNFRHICVHVRPTSTTSSSIELREVSQGKVAIEQLRGIGRDRWETLTPEALEKIALLYGEASNIMKDFSGEYDRLIERRSK